MNDSTRSPHTSHALRKREAILELLGQIVAQNAPVMTQLRESGQVFASRVRLVDAGRNALLLDPSANAQANAALMATKAIILQCRTEKGQIEIPTSMPVMDTLEGKPVLRFPLPDILIIRQRRTEPRIAPAASEPLHCVADEGGFLSFDAVVVDVSLSGMGALIYDSGIQLTPGTVLKECRISHSLGEVADLDIEVLHVEETLLPDGRKAYRAGCRFLKQNDALAQLVQKLAAKAA